MPEPSSDKKRQDRLRFLGGGAAGMLGGEMVTQGLRFTAAVLVSNGLGAAAFGSFGLLMGMEGFTRIFAQSGFPPTNLKFVAHHLALDNSRGVRTVARVTTQLSMLLSMVLFGLLWLLAPAIAEGIYNRPDLTRAIRILAASIPLSTVTFSLLSVVQAAKRIVPVILIMRVCVPLLFLVFVWAVVAGEGTLNGIAVGYLVAQGIGFVAAALTLSQWLRHYDKTRGDAINVREVVRFALMMSILGISALVMGTADVLILGKWLSSRDLGIYVAASRTAAFIVFPLRNINALFGPLASELFSRKDMQGLREMYRTATRWAAGACFAVFGLIVIAPKLILSVFGSEFPEGTTVLIILAVGQLLNGATGCVSWLMRMTGEERMAAGSVWAAATLLVIGLFIVPPIWGVTGAAVCASTVFGTVNLVGLVWMWIRLGMHPFDRVFGLYSLLTTGLILGLHWLKQSQGGAEGWGSLPYLAAFGVVFALLARYGWGQGLSFRRKMK